MKEETVRLSFDIPIEQHSALKSQCAQARITIKDFLHHLVEQGLNDLKEKELQNQLKQAIQEAKDGKVQSRGSFAKYVDDDEV